MNTVIRPRTLPSIFIVGLASAPALFTGCVEGVDLPGLLPQAKVTYGGVVYLVDSTRDIPPTGGWCTRLAQATTSSTTITPRDGLPSAINPNTPHNCYIRVETRELKVDVVETTNELFQLCVDSERCTAPDPSKASKNQLCSDEDAFEDCPVVEVPYDQANRMCEYLGRRLPTGLEHIIIRQAALRAMQPDPFDPALGTPLPQLYPNGRDEPKTCDDAILGAAECAKPRPVLSGGNPVGASRNDRITVSAGVVYDLIGNVSEWSADRLPADQGLRGEAAGYPWFCVAPLPGAKEGFSRANPPKCPVGAACVYGQYQPGDLPMRSDWPVCITASSGRFTGSAGSLFGGSYRDDDVSAAQVGIFGRRSEVNPNEFEDTARAREFGIRCVGDREPDDQGNLPEFDDQMVIQTSTIP